MLLALLLPVSIAIGQSIPDTDANAAMPDGTLLTSLAPSPTPAVALKPPAPKPPAKAAAPKPKPATAGAAKPSRSPAPAERSERTLASFTLRATAYNSLRGQTDSTPFFTSTGARTRFGIVALSRDMLRRIPYGSRVRLEDLGSYSSGRGRGLYSRMLAQTVFVVEDTMHPRKVGQVDVWFPARSQAVRWGVRRVRLTVLQLGRQRRG